MDSSDLIILDQLRVDCLVGVDAWERQRVQPLIISIHVAADIKGSVALVGDSLSDAHTVSYSTIQVVIREFLQSTSYRTLEALAMAIAHKCFVSCGVKELKTDLGMTVMIQKPKALLIADAVGIEITRTRRQLEELDQLLKQKESGLLPTPKLEPYDGKLGADKIVIKHLACMTIIGINPWERIEKQRLFVDITVHLHLESSFVLVDRIPSMFNFRKMVKKVQDYVESTSFKTIEVLIEMVASILLKDFRAPKVDITIWKPSAVIYANMAALRITRIREDLDMDSVSKAKKLKLDGADEEHTVFIGIGSNMGNRAKNITYGIKQLCAPGSGNVLLDTSFLYETVPMYVTDQNAFLNAAFKISTTLSPHDLLKRIKSIEEASGRDFKTIRNGPRTLDMDILFYDNLEMKTDELEIPHWAVHEREFVLRPLCDIAPNFAHPSRFRTVKKLLNVVLNTATYDKSSEPIQVMPFPAKLHGEDSILLSWTKQTRIMGILNVTPDSFSDGGKFVHLETAVSAAKQMVADGADILDIGGQSTRPGAEFVSAEEEIRRVIPVIEAVRKAVGGNILISVDTFHAAVARKAVEVGADLINDVSGGTMDETMIATLAELNVPVCIMHMRGTPQTMQTMTTYVDVTKEVTNVLQDRVQLLLKAGVLRWNIILDPGIGFAKTEDQNYTLLRELRSLTAPKSGLTGFPVLVGPSRKGFLRAGVVGNEDRKKDPGQRMWATAAACTAAVAGGAAIVRVHDVKEMKDVVATSDVVYRK